ncbi:Ras- protein Rab-10 [Tritrichomonas musculus]|uniref:Ras- protein Rab-10 n=1 Tax=Tritrichomonas musculus TaxID=1915356 RepID=A0ABR2H547_9EUKA
MLNLSREVNINASLDHPAVLKFIGYSPNNFENQPFPVIISEYATNGTLSRIIDLERKGLCESLTHITIPSSVKFIGHKAFCSCSSLTRVSIDSPIISIEDDTFRGCINLKEIIIPSSVISINQFAFCDCCRLKEIIIPTSVEYIKSNAFSKCSSLVQVKIPPSVCSIDSFSFAYCRRLKEISIPSSVNFIGDHAFYWCTSLEQITIPSSVQSIGNNAFNHCCSMKSISFQSSSSITSIETSTFKLCSFTEITIPRSVYLIHQFAFKNCKRLKEVKFLNKLTKIESDAFTGCSLLNNKNISVNESQIDFKAVILGGSCTGKTNIFYRYINNEYFDCSMATVGVDFRVKYLNFGGNKVKLQIWDTGGKEIFHDIIRTYFNPNDFIIIVIDLVYDETLDYSMRLFKEIREEIGQIPVVVLLNKCDLKRRNQLVIPELEKIKKEYDFKYFEVSAKENINIEESINYIATETFNSYFS